MALSVGVFRVLEASDANEDVCASFVLSNANIFEFESDGIDQNFSGAETAGLFACGAHHVFAVSDDDFCPRVLLCVTAGEDFSFSFEFGWQPPLSGFGVQVQSFGLRPDLFEIFLELNQVDPEDLEWVVSSGARWVCQEAKVF